MDRLVVDSWAWVEYFEGSVVGRKVGDMIEESSEIWTSLVSVTEVVSKYRRKRIDESKPMEVLFSLSKVDIPDRGDAMAAGVIHAEEKSRSPNFGLADSYVLQLARKVGAKVLTGDPDFRTVKEALLIE